MNYTDLLKRSFLITWRYRALWLFGFFLALCSGGSGGGNGGGNFNPPSGGFDEFDELPGDIFPSDPNVIYAIVIAIICLALLLAVIAAVVRVVSRTAIIGMVGQISSVEAVTIRDGWHHGWSSGAWRVFLLSLVIGIPLGILSFFLILLAFAPLLLLISGDEGLIIVSIILTVLAFLVVLLILLIIYAIATPILELSWRRAVLDKQGVFDSLGDTFSLVKSKIKEVVIVWLLLFGIGFAWVFVAIFVALASLLVAGVIGAVPALLVYFLSGSFIGALIAGGPLFFLIFISLNSFVAGLYLIFRSSVWTLTHLELHKPQEKVLPEPDQTSSDDAPDDDQADVDALGLQPQPET